MEIKKNQEKIENKVLSNSIQWNWFMSSNSAQVAVSGEGGGGGRGENKDEGLPHEMKGGCP